MAPASEVPPKLTRSPTGCSAASAKAAAAPERDCPPEAAEAVGEAGLGELAPVWIDNACDLGDTGVAAKVTPRVSRGVRSGDGGPGARPKTSRTIPARSSSVTEGDIGLRAPLDDVVRAISRAVASMSAVSRPSLRPSENDRGSGRMVRAA